EALPPSSLGTIGTSLASLLLPEVEEISPPPPVLRLTPLPDDITSPRVVNQTVAVGNRIVAPDGEQVSTDAYLAGYILQAKGNSFHPTAYKDPFVSGFTTANQGAIIPVNAIPGANHLEV